MILFSKWSDVSDDADIIHINDEVNPIADLDIIKDELRLKDIEFANTYLEGVEKIAKRGGQSLEVKQKKEEAEFVKSYSNVRRR